MNWKYTENDKTRRRLPLPAYIQTRGAAVAPRSFFSLIKLLLVGWLVGWLVGIKIVETTKQFNII